MEFQPCAGAKASRWEGPYCGAAPVPDGILLDWNFDPWAMALIVGTAIWAGHGRHGVAPTTVLAVAFLSPLCALSSALFSARVVRHLLLVAVAAPLLAMARPAHTRRAAGLPFIIATSALWLWHVPAAHDAALASMRLYWAMQASLPGSAWIFWRTLFAQHPGAGLGWVFLAYLSMGLLGAILTLAPVPLYAADATAPLAWGLWPLNVTLRRSVTWATVKLFAQTVAQIFAETEPRRFVATMSKERRKGRIFIDWLRNERGATAIAPFSLRARDRASVAVPVTWDELPGVRAANHFTPEAATERGWPDLPSAATLGSRALDRLAAVQAAGTKAPGRR